MHECTQGTRIAAIERALFGDEQLGVKGDHIMIQEMHKVLVEGGTVKKVMIWLFALIMGIGGAVLLALQIIKEWNRK